MLHLFNLIPLGTVCAVPYTVYIRLLWGSLGAVQWGSHLGLVSSVSSMLLEAGWLDQVAVPDPWYQSPATAAAATTVCFVTLLLFSPLPLSCLFYEACQHKSPLLIAIYTFPLCLSTYFPVFVFLTPLFLKLTCIYRAVADKQTVKALLWMASSCTSGGSVRSTVALQTVSIVLRMTHSTLQRMAVSQTVRQTDSTAQTDRLVCRAYRQTAQERQAERQIVCDRYSQHRTEADNLPI